MIWRLQYKNAHGDVARLDIQRGASTPIETIEGTENPFLLSYELEDKSKKGFIMSSFADISIYETATFNIDDLKTLDETALSVKWYINSVLEWTGFVVPDFFSRTIGEPGIVNLAASDRLSALKDATLDGLSEYITLRDLAEACLAKTGLSIPLYSTVDFKAGTTNVMDVFALSDRLEDDKGKKISCYDVLRSILVLTNSTIRQRKGQWRIYNKIQHEALTPSLNFNEVYQGAKRTIQPVFSSVGAFHEFGGGKRYPSNNNFQLATGWTAKNGFIFARENREVIGYTVTGSLPVQTYTPVFGDVTDNFLLANNNNIKIDQPTDIIGSPYLESEVGRVPYAGGVVEINVDLNAIAPNALFYHLLSGFSGAIIYYAVIAESPTETLILTKDSLFVPIANGWKNFQKLEFIPSEDDDRGAVMTRGGNLTALLDIGSSEYYNIRVRIYGSGSTITTFIDSISFSFSLEQDSGKGILYRTDQIGNFSKKSDPVTTIFGDYISSGLNGYFYTYPIDDKSLLRSPTGSNLPTSKWTTATDSAAGELPILQHVTRQMSRMFGVAHNVLSAVIDAKTFDPLAIVTNCAGEKYVIVYSVFDFLRSTVEVELQQIAYGSLQRRDFIFSYFGGGDGDGISSIGSVSGGGSSGGSGGGGIPQTLDLLADELFISGGNSVDLGVYARKTWVETEATAFNSARLGGQLASQYTRRNVAETISNTWNFIRINTSGYLYMTVNSPRIEFHDTETSQACRWVLSGGGMRLQTLEYGTSAYFHSTVNFSTLAPSNSMSLDGSGSLSVLGNITAQGNLDVTGISTFRDRIGTNTFVSGFTGDGTWRLQTGDETHLTIDRLTVRGRMDVYELVINQIRATNGSLWVTDAMKTTGAIPLSSFEFRFSFDNDNGNRGCTFVIGDIVKAQRFTGRGVVVFVGRVISVTANNFTLLTTGYMSDYTGDLETLSGLEFVRIGNTSNASNRQGSLYLTSSDSGAPYLDVLDGVNSASLAGKTKVRLGKLDGISDSELGSLTGYGLYAENAYLKGEIIAKSGLIGELNIESGAVGHNADNNKFIGMVSQTASNAFIGGYDSYLRRGFGMYHYDSATVSGGFKLMRMGMLSNSGSSNTFPSTPEYGFQIRLAATANDVFRVDSGGAFIAGITFNDSRLFTSRWWIDKDGSFSLGNGKITGTAAGNVTIDGSLVTQHITAQSIEGLDLNFTKGTIGGFTIGATKLSGSGLDIEPGQITFKNSSNSIIGNLKFDGQLNVIRLTSDYYANVSSLSLSSVITLQSHGGVAIQSLGSRLILQGENGITMSGLPISLTGIVPSGTPANGLWIDVAAGSVIKINL